MSKSRNIGNDNKVDRNNRGYRNNSSIQNKLDIRLEKLSLKEDDILIIKTGNMRIGNKELVGISKHISSRISKNIPIIIAPDEIVIEKIEMNDLNNIISQLEKIRDSHWKDKINGGNKNEN